MKGSYDRERERLAKVAADRSARGREIGAIPDVADPRRRGRCRGSLRLFCETYNPEPFHFAWSPDHLKVIARVEEAVTLGALYAFALPRGSGKTTICRMAALWAVSYAHCRYAYVVGATDEKARETLDTLRVLIRFLPDYAADFPEVSFPAARLDGIANRASGQTCGGRSTLIEWSADRVVLPTVPPPSNWPRSWPLRSDGMVPTSGAVVSASGLTGEGIRGSLKTLTTGEMVRPDFVLADDPQTPESARSPTQNRTRLRLISADVLGMAGPGRSISGVMPCTVIEVDDMVDEVLDRERHPLWRGERAGILRSMPSDLAAWDGYFDVYRRCAQLEPPDFAAANAHYRAHRAELEAGAEASWPDRRLPGEVSAVQHAMHLYFRDRRGFWAEYMNAPERAPVAAGAKQLDAGALAGRLSGTDRHVVPRECTRLTAGIDCGARLLWYVVTAWTEAGGGCVIDYGCWPRQARAAFAADDARPALAAVHRRPDGGEMTEAQLVFAGLRELTAEVLGREYHREGGGGGVRVERALVDAGWQAAAVYQFVRQSPHAGVLLPSKGVGRTATARGVGEWKPRPGERAGHHWRVGVPERGRGRSVLFDPDAWKTLLWERLTTPPGAGTALTLFGTSAGAHAMISEHLAAEYSSPVTLRGQSFDKWAVRPDRPDNHLLDCAVLSAVAASVLGLRLEAATETGRPAEVPRAPARRMSEVLAAKRDGRAPAGAGGGGVARAKLSEILARKRGVRR